jgi:uncharacterized membrane protein
MLKSSHPKGELNMNNNLSSQDKFITKNTYKSLGFTESEIKKLQDTYPQKNSSREQKQNYQELLSHTLKTSAHRRDNKRVAYSFLSGMSALSLLSIAKAAHTCSEPKILYTCIGLSIFTGLYSIYCFKNIEETSKELDQKFKKAEQKAKLNWEKLIQKEKERTK